MDESEESSELGSSSRPHQGRQGNILPIWGNRDSMNFNSLILDNVLASPYFKNQLVLIKTYHEVIDEIYYNVSFSLLPELVEMITRPMPDCISHLSQNFYLGWTSRTMGTGDKVSIV